MRGTHPTGGSKVVGYALRTIPQNMSNYRYQETQRYFAQVADDIKDIAEQELRTLGARETSPTYRGIYFSAAPKALYTINFYARLITRVLAPLTSFRCHSDRYLYKKAREVEWQDFLDPSQTFAVFATVANSAIRHSQFAALRLKDAVVDSFRAATGVRPSIDTKEPDVWLNLYIHNNEATLSLDTSGGSLHRRGYRKKSVRAPLVETLAAAIIQHAEWDGRRPLYDPLCGSGTLLCEAYMAAARMPAGLFRKRFGFESLPDFDAALWKRVQADGQAALRALPPGLISGSDIDPEAVRAARANCAAFPAGSAITVEQRDAFQIRRIDDAVIVCNPPYGIRLGKQANLDDFYVRLGDFLKQRCQGSTAFIYCGDRHYLKRIGLKPAWKKPLVNGGLDGRLAKYELY